MKGIIEEINVNLSKLEGNTGRVLHGRGKTFSGYEDITVEYFSGLILIIMFNERPESWRLEFSSLLGSAPCSSMIDTVLFQARYEKESPVFDAVGNIAVVEKIIKENSLNYQLSLGGRQNYGFFTDIVAGRTWVREHSSDCRVLNLFSYTCSFSVAAIAGGANHVVNVDMSSAALTVGRVNHKLNNSHELGKKPSEKVSFQKLNILKSWSRIGRSGPYDLVIVDPPSFQKGSFSTDRDYKKIVNRLAVMTAEGADILFCLNDPLITVSAFRELLESEHFKYVSRVDNAPVMKEADAEVGLKVLHYKKLEK
jgi:23S rRNA (cytosine1962-C5)-methyltransferase